MQAPEDARPPLPDAEPEHVSSGDTFRQADDARPALPAPEPEHRLMEALEDAGTPLPDAEPEHGSGGDTFRQADDARPALPAPKPEHGLMHALEDARPPLPGREHQHSPAEERFLLPLQAGRPAIDLLEAEEAVVQDDSVGRLKARKKNNEDGRQTRQAKRVGSQQQEVRPRLKMEQWERMCYRDKHYESLEEELTRLRGLLPRVEKLQVANAALTHALEILEGRLRQAETGC